MSSAFWIELVLALLGFTAVLCLLPQFRVRVLRRARARALRVKLAAKIQRLLPLIAVANRLGEFDEQALQQRSMLLTAMVNELHDMVNGPKVLFSDEYTSLNKFMFLLKANLPQLQLMGPATTQQEDLILLGQRMVSDLQENKG